MRFLVVLLILFLMGLLFYPLLNAWPFFESISMNNWLSFDWTPEAEQYGMSTAIVGSLFIVFMSLPISLVLGWVIALQLADTQSKFLRSISVPILETWISLPSVIIGVWAISQLVPVIRTIDGSGYCILAASIGLTLFIAPTTALLFYRAYVQFGEEYSGLEKSFAMNGWERTFYFFKSRPQIFVSTSIYTFCRLFGETMIVLMLSGNSLQIPGSVFEGVRSLTATIALEMAYASGMHETALFAMASVAILFIFLVLIFQRGVKYES